MAAEFQLKPTSTAISSSQVLLVLLLLLPCVFSGLNSTSSRPRWECSSGSDGNHFCVYTNSLCIDSQKGLLLVTDNADLRGHREPFADRNILHDSPFHAPNVNDLNIPDIVSVVAPFRSYLTSATFVLRDDLPSNVHTLDGDNLLVSFEFPGYNPAFYHYVNKMQVAFLARFHHLLGFGHSSSDLLNPPLGARRKEAQKHLESLVKRNDVKAYKRALLLKSNSSSWQLGYSEIAVGVGAEILHLSDIDLLLQRHGGTVCFERTVVPGTSLHLGDGLLTSLVFREMAANTRGIRVPHEQRNFLTIMDQSHMMRRRILNLDDVVCVAQEEEALSRAGRPSAFEFIITVASFTDADSFELQSLHMARTRILVATHGAVLAHCLMMETGGVVYEINGYQFNYPLYQQIVASRGHYYLRDEAELANTQVQGHAMGFDPLPNATAGDCARDSGHCFQIRRDADVVVDLAMFRKKIRQALSLVRFGTAKESPDTPAPAPAPALALAPAWATSLLHSTSRKAHCQHDARVSSLYVVCLLPGRADLIADHIRSGLRFEPHIADTISAELDALVNWRESGSVFLDVGSNHGVFSLQVASLGAKVISIDALAANAAILLESLRVSSLSGVLDFEKLVRVFHVGVADKPREPMCAVLPSDNESDAILVAADRKDEHEYVRDLVARNGCAEEVMMTTIDNVLASPSLAQDPNWANAPVSILKLDIEGMDLPALVGASELLADPRRKPCSIIAELNPGLALRESNGGWTSQMLCSFMAGFSYEVYDLHSSQPLAGNTVDFNTIGELGNVLFRLALARTREDETGLRCQRRGSAVASAAAEPPDL